MSPVLPPPRLHRAAVWRGDLLRALTAPGAQPEALALLLGYAWTTEAVPEPPAAQRREATPAAGPPPAAMVASAPAARRTATHYQIEQQVLTPASAGSDPVPQAQPFTEMPEAHGDQPVLPQRPLVSAARLADFARRQLRRPAASSLLDLDRWIARVVRAELPRRLPTRRLKRWSGASAVLLNGYGDAEPIRDDLGQWASLIWRCSGGALPVYLLNPEGALLKLKTARGQRHWQPADLRLMRQHRHWLWAGADSAGTRAAADLRGLLTAPRAADRSLTWLQVGARASGSWLPVDQTVAWDVGSALRARPARGLDAPLRFSDVERLLGLMSLAIRVEPALLRELRLLLKGSLHAEWAAWQHGDVQRCPIACWIDGHEVARWRSWARQHLPAALLRQAAALIEQHHRHLSPLILAEEAALAAAIGPETPAAHGEAVALWEQVVATLRDPGNRQSPACERYTRRLGQRADPGLWQANPAVAEAWVLAEQSRLRAGAALPDGISGALVARVLAPTANAERRRWWLLQDGRQLTLSLAQTGAAIAELSVTGDGLTLTHGHRQVWLRLDASSVPLSTAQMPMQLWQADRVTRISEIPRPAWAWEFGRDAEGVYVLTPPLGKRQAKFYAVPAQQAAAGQPFLPTGRDELFLEWQDGENWWRLGFDAAYGAFAELQRGDALQRFRWIAPGEFWMGSPEEERGDNDERPRHRVRISTGFWLADTACTQALWQAVCGKNPSYFKGDLKCPVESVSWDDVQAFLQALNPPAFLTPDLPTEAEWEYACRAGTVEPFHFGAQITPELVNYDGNYPYARGQKGLYRKRTVPVKGLPANHWGLFQLHGNVWEWCRDGRRDYADAVAAVEDPEGPQDEGGVRVLRGGSWSGPAGDARSAFRHAALPNYRGRLLGFRLVLRSTSPAAEPEAVLWLGTVAGGGRVPVGGAHE